MSKLEELIQQYCPDGVEYKPIGEVCKTKTPPAKLKTSDYKEQGLYHIIDQGQGQYAGFTDDEYYLLPDAEYVLYGDHTCIVKYHNGCFAQGADGLKILVPTGQNVKYVYYALSAYNLTNTEYKRHWTQAKEIEIPIPPLPVQEEIVRVLDTFTELQAELQAELQKRLQQYNYYRDNLLSFEGRTDVEWKKLGEVSSVLRGKRLTKSQLSEDGKYKVFHGGIDPIGSFEQFNREGSTTMVINVGASAGTVGFSKERFWSSDGCFCLSHSSLFSGRYLYYYLQTKEPYLMSRVRRAGIPTLDGKVLEELLIPVPSISEQQRIVDVLDRFDTLTTDLTAGLPAEIEKRRQQYEYYRDKLLTFKKKEA